MQKKLRVSPVKSLLLLSAAAGIFGSAALQAEVCPDPDGDGWGFANGKSCLVGGDATDTATSLPADAVVGLSTTDNCPDPDGDGWGFANGKSCQVGSHTTSPDTSLSASLSTIDPCPDPDGDGWGFANGESCLASSKVITAATSVPASETCPDPDGDGWGFANGQSCRVDQPAVTDVSTVAEPNNTIVPVAAAAAVSTGRHLKVLPSVCEIENGESGCDVFASYQGEGSGPHCLFASEAGQDAELITCGSPTRVRIGDVSTTSKVLELRRGSLDYAQSTPVDSVSVVGLRGIKRGSYSLQDTRQSTVLRNDKASSLATSWDGRLHFDVVGTTNGKRVSVVRMFRPERLDNQSATALQNNNLFSTGYIFASDSLSNSEKSSSSVRVPGELGTNRIGIEVPFNIAVFPNASMVNNPYRSDAAGNVSDGGSYETYRFYVLMGARKVGNVVGEYDINIGNPARGKKFFLTKFEASVVVKNARTVNADVHNVVIHNAAEPMRDVDGQLIYGYEPSVTLDGRLVVYSGNASPALRNGNGGEISYIYQQNQHLSGGWSKPRGIAEMYYVHGPGGNEVRVNGDKRFSEHFPFAALPLRQYNGESLGQGDFIKGAYPWVSPRGSEIFFQARATFHGADRSGATVGGLRTNGQLWHLDGDINNSRGNPTDRYDHWESGDGSGNQYKSLVAAYESRRFAGTSTTMGRNTWSNLFFRPLAQYPTSWSAVTDLKRSPLPVNPFPESYGFWLTGNRYYEMTFPMYAKDLVAYYPMNEPLYQDQSLLRPYMKAEPGRENPESIRRRGVDHVIDKTADLSQYQHTATLRNGAQYPFEHYDVKNTWSRSGVLKDQSEGALGNSIFFSSSASATSTLSAASVAAIADTQSFSTALWVNSSNAGSSVSVLRIAGLLDLSVGANQITARVSSDGDREAFQANANLQSGRWHHVAVSWRSGDLRILVDGVQVARHRVNAELTLRADQSAEMVMGPAGSGAGNLLLKLDEVYIYSTWLALDDITRLALKKRVFQQAQNSFYQRSGMAADYPRVAADTDLSFAANDSVVALGEQLFNSSSLSRNNTISCASCHQASREFSDGQALSTGVDNITGTLNTPAIANSLLSRRYFYSGGASALETQSIHTIMQNGEMGISDADHIVGSLPGSLRDQMRAVYQREANLSDLAGSLAAFVKTIRVAGRADPQSMSAAAQRGRRLFDGKANCVACHSGSNLSDNQFHDIGLGGETTDRAAATGRRDDRFRRKTPTLRNVALTAPYFHDGSVADLPAVVRHYNDLSHRASGRITDPLLHPLELNDGEIDDLVEYLSALNGATLTR